MQQISYRNWNHYRRGRGLALWAKILIGLGVLSLIGLLIVVVFCGRFSATLPTRKQLKKLQTQ